eukprot:CAMPEP_0184646834 /NCGR_PEP_ID=MMETSP0308-20130426/3626_1 /TAXON_ID=38269 /ORGANISM="Gloeochaete witrockiana, Strain SAG 46.84" /LENGTH=425 /DNA_ID=CAMNT_0027077249 /DNA_START=578 /DNA_END=1855 /DNA_ORIENTATION=+
MNGHSNHDSVIPPQASSGRPLRFDPPVAPRMRVALFVEPSPFTYVCGLTARFRNTIRQLREAGDEVLIISPEASSTPTVEDFHGAKVVQIPGFVFMWYQEANYRLSTGATPRVWQAIRDFKPDVLHVVTPGFMVWGGLLLRNLLGIPLVLSYHTHVPRYIPSYTNMPALVRPMWGLIRMWHNLADRTLVTSESMHSELTQEGVHRVHVWQHGIDTDRFHPSYDSKEMRARLAGGAEHAHKPLLVHVGRLGAEKNLQHLRPILERLETKDVRLGVVGAGPYRDKIESSLEGTEAVFTGLLQGDELSQAYASADIFVMPSETETLGFVVLEAMASGTAVVACRAGGIPDLVDHGITGMLYDPEDMDGAAKAVDELLSNPTLRENIVARAREKAEQWGWKRATNQLRSMYYEVLSGVSFLPSSSSKSS